MTVGKAPKDETPAWALVLESLGWLIIAAGILPTAAIAIGLFRRETPQGLLTVIPLLIALVSATWFIGSLLMALAKAAGRGKAVPRWRLWAQVLLRIGGIFCVSVPTAIYGTLPAGLEVARATSEQISPVDAELLQMELIVGGPFFLLGLAFVIPALVWGRYKSAPDLPAVFS